MSKNKGKSTEELLQEALVPEDEQPYKVPENWMWVTLGSIAEFIYGKSLPASQRSNEGYPVFGSNGIVGFHDEFLIEGPVIVVGRKGSHGEVSWFEESGWPIDTTYYVKPLGQLHYRYLYYLLLTINLKKLNRSTAIPGLNREDAYKQKVAIPPLSEQKRIADKVERLLHKINQAKQMIEEAKETFELRRSAILDKAFRGELTANWREQKNMNFNLDQKKLGDLIEEGPQNGLYKAKDAYGEGTLIVRIDSFYNGEIKEWETLKRLQLEENEITLYGLNNNDVIINRVNSIEYLGKSALVRNLVEPAVFESNVMRLKINDKVIPEFLILYLNSYKGLEELRKNAKHAVNQASINQQDVKNVLVPLPKIEEQIEIVRMLNLILNKEEKTRNCIDLTEKINRLESSILSKAFRSELGTNNLNEESALELLKNILVKDT
ncbi:restriction endonuclease subunit S [Paenibacillus wynnii]|uniref:restriction endonuclease subunit S n=1 Tax=Paenibacillus wynnii TaxID=268407 RepID=UPI0009FC2498|nr:restriction endonuclease subunit S [Paenibacillus wynnii]